MHRGGYMAKRFTGTDKWSKAWFCALNNDEKVIWMYILDKCDHAGFFNKNYTLASFETKCAVNDEVLNKIFQHKIIHINEQKCWIRSFVSYQYGSLNDNVKAHKSVLTLLKKYENHIKENKQLANTYVTVAKQLPNSCLTVQDKDKDKDKDQEKGGVGGKNIKLDFNALYNYYPRKQGKSRGFQKCRVEIKTPSDYELLKIAIARYKDHVEKASMDPKFVKHFSTFMSEWRDWLDEKNGSCEIKTAQQKWQEDFILKGEEEERIKSESLRLLKN